MEKYPANKPNHAITLAWDSFQSEFKCCGVDGFHDWAKHNSYFHGDDTSTLYQDQKPNYSDQDKVPESCCDGGSSLSKCAKDPTTSNGLHGIGCFTLMKDEIMKHEAIIGSVAIGV